MTLLNGIKSFFYLSVHLNDIVCPLFESVYFCLRAENIVNIIMCILALSLLIMKVRISVQHGSIESWHHNLYMTLF